MEKPLCSPKSFFVAPRVNRPLQVGVELISPCPPWQGFVVDPGWDPGCLPGVTCVPILQMKPGGSGVPVSAAVRTALCLRTPRVCMELGGGGADFPRGAFGWRDQRVVFE